MKLNSILLSLIQTLDILFCQITTLIKVGIAFVFGLRTLLLIDFTTIHRLKGLEHTNFYEHCDLKKSISDKHVFE